ncbi:MAG: exodeoxyribonuclease VII large subunit, partial [Oscillospiraceae bacterium]
IANMQNDCVGTNRQNLQKVYHVMYNQMDRILADKKSRVKTVLYQIDASNPFEILKKGYTITTHENKKIYDINTVNTGDTIVTQTKQGSIVSTVCKITKNA